MTDAAYFTEWAARNAEWAMDEAEEVVSLYPSHPGPLLRDEVLEPRNISTSELARTIGASRPDLSNMLNGKKAFTVKMATRIEAAVGYSAELLMRLQLAHDLAHVRQESRDRLKAIPKLVALA